MKLALVAALALAGCITVDRGHPAPESESLMYIYSDCGYAPASPKWSYTEPAGDPTHVVVPSAEFAGHNAWVVATIAWSNCVQGIIDSTATP